MLTTEDYIELVSAGVDAGMVSLVEGAYRCLFEATTVDTIPVRPVDYVAIAGNLGIDITDCINDGEPDSRAVERKVTASPEFKKLAEYVDSVMDMGMDYSGLGYRDGSGMIKYNYSEFNKNPSIRNVIGNMRNALLGTVSGTAGLTLDNPVIKEALARKIGNNFRYMFTAVVDRGIRANVDDITPDDADTGGTADIAYISKINKVKWVYAPNPDGNNVKLTSTENTDIYLDKNGNVTEVLINDNDTEWTDVLECMAYGPVNGVTDNFITDCQENYYANTWANIVFRTSSEVLVGLLRKIPDMFRMLEQHSRDSSSSHLYPMLKGIEILVSAYDSGDIDAEGITDIVNHAGDPGYISSKYGIDLLTHVSKIIGGGSTQFNTRIFSMIPDIANSITGTKADSSWKLPGATWDTILSIAEHDNLWDVNHIEMNSDVVALMSSPEVQRKIYRTTGTARLTSLCSSIARNLKIFIPIDPDIMSTVFLSGYRTHDAMEDIVKLYGLYIVLISKCPLDDSTRMNSRNVERIFADIRKYITPRVQRELSFDEDGLTTGSSIKELVNFSRYVPGFRVDPRVGGTLLYNADSRIKNIPATAFIAAFNKDIIYSGNLIEASTSPDVLDNVFHKTPVGLRIMELVTNFLNNRKHLSGIFDKLADCIYDGGETRIVAEKFLSNYIVTKKAALGGAVTEVAKRGGLRQLEDGFDVKSLFGFGMMAIMDKFNEPVGKRPSIASILFLSKGSWLDFNNKKMWDDCKVEGEIWLLMELISISKPWVPLMLVNSLGGQNMLSDVGTLNTSLEVRAKIMNALFRADLLVSEKAPNATPLVSDEEFEQMTRDNPKMLLLIMDVLSPERKKQAEAICFNPEFMENLAGTLDGMRLLIELGKMSGLTGFSEQFILSHKNKITEALELMLEMGADQKEIDELRNTMFGSTRGLQQEGGKISDDRLGRVEYNLANGLRWMTGYVKVDSGLSGAGDSCTLFPLAGAMEYIRSLGENSMWRLPTSEELRNLGTPETVTRLGIGFSPTGKGDSDGEFDDVFDSACYAWYCDKGNYGGYSVSYGMINIDDSDIEEGDYLAIKLVSRA